MNIKLEEVMRDKENKEVFYNIINVDNGDEVGILFTIEDHIAYEVYEKYRGQGIATDALKYITSKLNKPSLEIQLNNIASKKVALKAGYTLVKTEGNFEIYHMESKKK